MGCFVSNAVMEKKSEVAVQEAVTIDTLGSPKVVPVAQRGSVGEGDLPVQILVGHTHSFGPINLRGDDEVDLVNALIKERCDMAKHRGSPVKEAPQYHTIAERAKSVLHPEVVKFIKYAFTLKGLKEHRIGRRRNQYQKRSEVIKIGRNGELIYPSGHPFKAMQDEVNNNADPLAIDRMSNPSIARPGTSGSAPPIMYGILNKKPSPSAKKFNCHVCSQPYKYLGALRQHMRKYHGQAEEWPNAKAEEDDKMLISGNNDLNEEAGEDRAEVASSGGQGWISATFPQRTNRMQIITIHSN